MSQAPIVKLRWWSLLLAILLIALVPRAAVAVAFDDPPTLQNDAGWYDFFGSQISAGHGYALPDGAAMSRWPPGYPYFLGAVYRLTGDSRTAVRLAQALLGAITAVLAAELTRRTISARVGLACGLLVAVLPTHVLYSSLLMSEVLFTFLIVLAMLLAVAGGGWRRSLLTGLVLGAAALVRGHAVVLAVPIVVWWLVASRIRIADRRAAVATLSALAGGFVLMLAPWTIRNAVQLHEFQPGSTNLGITLWTGNNPDATGAVMIAPVADFERETRDLAEPEREVRFDALARDAALRYIVHHPAETLALAPRKVVETYRNDRSFGSWYEPQGTGYLDPALRAWLGRLCDVYYYVLLLAAAAGMVLLLRARSSGSVLPLASLLIWSLVGVVFYGETRYHVPVLPLLAIPAAYAIVRLVDAWIEPTPVPGPGAARDESTEQRARRA